MSDLHSFFVVVSVIAAIFVPQYLILLYAERQHDEYDAREYDFR